MAKPLSLKKALKGTPHGEHVVGWIKERTRIQIETPHEDDLSNVIYPRLKKILPTLAGSFLDVGCYGGWLYHFVKERVDYHGIDIWLEAVQAAQDLFPPERFSLEDLRTTNRRADIVWGMQLHPIIEAGDFIPLLHRLSNKRVFWTEGRKDLALNESLFREVIDHERFYEGIKW